MIQHKTHKGGTYREIADLTETERHRLLASERRRILITILSTHSSPADFETLAATVAERDTTVDSVDEATVEQMKLLLHHKHFPMLADLDLIEFDPESDQIDFSENWSY